MQHWEHNIEGRYTKQKQKQRKHNAENWKNQRRPLQKPGMNLKMTNIDHYKNRGWTYVNEKGKQ